MEVTPPVPQRNDEFLVVLIPRGVQPAASPRIRKLANNGEHGVEIVTDAGTRRWWFKPGRNGVRLEALNIDEAIFPPRGVTDRASTPWGRFKAWWKSIVD
jgi:hypothetical protein